MERSVDGVVARIGGEPIRALAQLAAQVPVLLLNPDSHRLLEDGPKWRRRFMDWGLFQTDALFIEAWRRYGAALRNRNGALRMQSNDRTVDAWDRELSHSAVALDTARQKFCASLQRQLSPLLAALLGGMETALEYRRGWSRDQDLRQALHASREQDRRQGYTRLGPHRADFVVKLEGGGFVPERLSRGQQKLLIIALVLAQARLYQVHRDSPCMLLIDDLPSELDRAHRDRVMSCLARSDAQLFVTAIEAGALDTALWEESRVFHLAHGNVSLMA
jgi:DNA replication and repair protein RecF